MMEVDGKRVLHSFRGDKSLSSRFNGLFTSDTLGLLLDICQKRPLHSPPGRAAPKHDCKQFVRVVG